MASTTRSDVMREQRRFSAGLTVSLTAMLVIVAWPKGWAGPGEARFRFACAQLFFGACAGLLWALTEPRSRYMRALYAWRYEGRSESFERNWKRYLHLLDRVIAWPSGAGMALVASLEARTVIAWYQAGYPAVQKLAGPTTLACWLALGALLAFLFPGASWLQELLRRRWVLDEEVALADGSPPRRLTDRPDPAERNARRPVVQAGPGRFHAGGMTWRLEDLCQGVAVFGQVGSGKTACVLNALLDGILGADQGPEPVGGLILDPKGDFLPKLRHLAERHGRADDLHVIDPTDPEHSPRWNPLDTDDNPVEVAGRLLAVMETLGVRAGDSSFFHDYARKFLHHALALLRATSPASMVPTFAELGRLARDPEATRARVARADGRDRRLAESFAFFAEWLGLARETRDGVIGSVTNIIDPFLAGPYDVAFGSPSTLRTGELIDLGKLVYLSLPATGDTEIMARLVGTLLKVDYLREVTARLRLRKRRPTFFLCDEFQKYLTTGGGDGGGGRGDADYFELTREFHHANVIAMQNLHSLLKVAPRPEAVWNLLGNCATKVFLRNTDPDTNQYASRHFGETTSAGMDYGPRGAPGGGWFMGASLGGLRDQRAPLVPPELFTRLAIPKASGSRSRFAESYVFQGAAAEIRDPARKRRWPVHPIVAHLKHAKS